MGCTGTGVNNSAFSFTKFWGCGGMNQVEHSMCLMLGWQEKKEKEASGNCRGKTHLSSMQTGTRQSFLSMAIRSPSLSSRPPPLRCDWHRATTKCSLYIQEASLAPFSGCQEAAASGPSIGRGCPGVTQVTALSFSPGRRGGGVLQTKASM